MGVLVSKLDLIATSPEWKKTNYNSLWDLNGSMIYFEWSWIHGYINLKTKEFYYSSPNYYSYQAPELTQCFYGSFTDIETVVKENTDSPKFEEKVLEYFQTHPGDKEKICEKRKSV